MDRTQALKEAADHCAAAYRELLVAGIAQREAQEALFQLREEYGKKMSALEKAELELKRIARGEEPPPVYAGLENVTGWGPVGQDLKDLSRNLYSFPGFPANFPWDDFETGNGPDMPHYGLYVRDKTTGKWDVLGTPCGNGVIAACLHLFQDREASPCTPC
jgi:hypothetical protein